MRIFVLCVMVATYGLYVTASDGCSELREEFEDLKHDVEKLVEATPALLELMDATLMLHGDHGGAQVDKPNVNSQEDAALFFNALAVASTVSQRHELGQHLKAHTGTLIDGWMALDAVGKRIASAFYFAQQLRGINGFMEQTSD